MKNIKGIKNEKFEFNLLPYSPNFFVAPNGFGKSSFATGFSSLNRDRIHLDKDNFFNQIDTNEPILSIDITNDDGTSTKLTANKDKNEISKVFDVCVINNQIKPEANYRKIHGAPIVSPSLEISNIYMIEGIPDKCDFTYQVTKFKKEIDDSRQIWTDISDILQNKILISNIYELNILEKFSLIKQNNLIDSFVDTVKAISGTKDEIIKEINNSCLSLINSEYFDSIVKEIGKFEVKTEGEIYLIAIQIIKTYKSDKSLFEKVVEYYRYFLSKNNILNLFKSFNTTWKGILPKEINITKKVGGKPKIIGKNFGIEFPCATDISNGERDVITFIGMLLKAQINFGKKPTILIIDEVFDYLDDANLIAVQFYITKFIEFYKERKQLFFPIILTHLNPYYFKNYFFSNQKVYYLQKWVGTVNRSVENIVVSRNNTTDNNYADKISCYFLHYNTQTIDLENEMKTEFINQKLGNIDTTLCKSQEFINSAFASFDNYVKGKKNYDPLSVCLATRIKIENKIYNLISSEPLKKEFINTKMTVNKLDFASENAGVNIPEVYYLLGTLYNEILHIKKNIDNSSPIYLKLNNITIKNMIQEIDK